MYNFFPIRSQLIVSRSCHTEREKKLFILHRLIFRKKEFSGISKCYSFGQYRSVHGNGKFILSTTKKDFEKKKKKLVKIIE